MLLVVMLSSDLIGSDLILSAPCQRQIPEAIKSEKNTEIQSKNCSIQPTILHPTSQNQYFHHFSTSLLVFSRFWPVFFCRDELVCDFIAILREQTSQQFQGETEFHSPTISEKAHNQAAHTHHKVTSILTCL